MKKRMKLMVMGGVLIASVLSTSIEATYDTTFHRHVGNIITVANAQENTELTLSIQKKQDLIEETLKIESIKDDIKQSIQEEEKIAFQKAEALRIEEERKKVEEEKRQAAIQKENYLKSINPYYDKVMKIKTSFYSENEPTNVPGNEIKTCTGLKLFKGVIAAPKEIPLYSIFLIDNTLYMVLDRGNEKIIKMYGNDEGNGTQMKVDIYVPNTSSKQLLDKGVVTTDCKIIRYGGSKETLNDDVKKMNEYNMKLSNGEDINLYDLFN